MIIEIFAGTARVRAELRKLGMVRAFRTDHVRHKQLLRWSLQTSLQTDEGVNLLMQWLADEHVVSGFIAPPVVRLPERDLRRNG